MPLDTMAPKFVEMLEQQRYLDRSLDFEEIIHRTREHFWDPEDADYIDFEVALDKDATILPYEFVPELQSEVASRVDERGKLLLAREHARWLTSSFLHGEQGALTLSLKLGCLFLDPGAQEYAANQAREEARHVHGFTKYIASRFGGRIMQPSAGIRAYLDRIVGTNSVYEKIVGMQMVIEGIAMGAFSQMFVSSSDPVLRRLCQLTLTDEAFHHRFGKMWAKEAIPALSEEDFNIVEDFALESFNILFFNALDTAQKGELYHQLGLDPEWVRGAVIEAFGNGGLESNLTAYRTFVRTLMGAGLITDRTREEYAAWIDIADLSGSDVNAGEEIAKTGLASLSEINASKRSIIRTRSGSA